MNVTVRRRILANLSQVRETTTGELQQCLFDVAGSTVAKELHDLAHTPGSGVQHNGQVGRGSRYTRKVG